MHEKSIINNKPGESSDLPEYLISGIKSTDVPGKIFSALFLRILYLLRLSPH
jgi:hypothetical protein